MVFFDPVGYFSASPSKAVLKLRVEPQIFDDSVNGKSVRVPSYRKGWKVNVYWK